MIVSDNPSFQERLGDGLRNVADVQKDAAELAKNFELGTENDIAKVMVSQQVSSLAYQLTNNVRNKALSANKDIMNMTVKPNTRDFSRATATNMFHEVDFSKNIILIRRI
mgnify:CR=1 FL=1